MLIPEYENIIFSMELLASKIVDVCETEYLLPLAKGNINLPVHFKKVFLNMKNCLRFLMNVTESVLKNQKGQNY